MTPSEELVFEICRRSFLSLWSYANPQGKEKGKELCDVLIVCDPDVVIFSVKEIEYRPGEDETIGIERWRKRAIDKSAHQIYGAERRVRNAEEVTTADGKAGLPLPSEDRMRIHRIAVALGGKGHVPIHFGDFGKGFVHVFDDVSLRTVMRELDTVTDFVDYLIAKEQLYERGALTLFLGGEEDLLAVYLHQGREFPQEYDLITVDDGIWEVLQEKEEMKARRIADQDSYAWDRLIEWILESGGVEDAPVSDPGIDAELSDPRTDGERVMRVMARETRFSRRVLGKHLKEFLELAAQNKVRSRMLPALSGVMYVLLLMPMGSDRQYRIAELAGRCWVARGLKKDFNPVVGLAFQQGPNHSLDMFYFDVAEWTSEHQEQLEYLQREFDYFVQPRESKISEDEYPGT